MPIVKAFSWPHRKGPSEDRSSTHPPSWVWPGQISTTETQEATHKINCNGRWKGTSGVLQAEGSVSIRRWVHVRGRCAVCDSPVSLPLRKWAQQQNKTKQNKTPKTNRNLAVVSEDWGFHRWPERFCNFHMKLFAKWLISEPEKDWSTPVSPLSVVMTARETLGKENGDIPVFPVFQSFRPSPSAGKGKLWVPGSFSWSLVQWGQSSPLLSLLQVLRTPGSSDQHSIDPQMLGPPAPRSGTLYARLCPWVCAREMFEEVQAWLYKQFLSLQLVDQSFRDYSPAWEYVCIWNIVIVKNTRSSSQRSVKPSLHRSHENATIPFFFFFGCAGS